MALRFFNTLTRQVDEFVPREAGKVAMYSCGPTVYDRAHIGNFRAFLFVDLLRRYLKYRGYQVFSVMNLTDIDDKTIRGAQKEGVTLREFTDKFIKIFFDEWEVLRIQKADLHPRATDHIPEMVKLVETLEARGHAYKAEDNSHYYKVESFPTYGQFARLDMSGMQLGARVSSDEYEKESARDFALWKGYASEDGDVYWDTPLGKGRPGWHLECSAMSLKYLGEDFDIHTGGVDLIFPHHQNEIAQTEGATGVELARYWLHNEHLLVEGAKMSKSLGNFFTLDDLQKLGWKPREIRYTLLSAHYRQQLNFTVAGLEAARSSLERIDACLRNLKFAEGGGAEGLTEMLARHEADFREAMDDDLNYPNALAVLFNLIRDINTLCAEQKVGPHEAEQIREVLRRLDSVFGFLDVDAAEGESDEEIELLIQARNEARKAKDWAEADRIRQKLADANVILEDRAGGTVWRRK